MNKLQLSRLLMLGSIALIAAFQCYWLNKVYREEYGNLQRRADVLLKETVQQVREERMLNLPASLNPRDIEKVEVFKGNSVPEISSGKKIKTITIRSQQTDTTTAGRITILDGGSNEGLNNNHATIKVVMKPGTTLKDTSVVHRFFKITADSASLPALPEVVSHSIKDSLKNKDSEAARTFVIELNKLNDTIPLSVLYSRYDKLLKKEEISLNYELQKVPFKRGAVRADSLPATENRKMATHFAFSGVNDLTGYYALFESPFAYITRRMVMPVCFSLVLIVLTVVSFVFIYRNMLAQRRLADMKNEFISNITHELKTPVATVNVAIEALRNFNALQDTVKTKEYLEIGAIELQRLSLLIDKVLRFGMFESHKVALQTEQVDLVRLTREIINSIRLQTEKAGAKVYLQAEDDSLLVQADKLHMASVVYNLLDNAVKYSPVNPVINIHLCRQNMMLVLTVSDNGIGIPAAFTGKVFDKFFRVPSNDRHNIRGYGLGLSYVAHIVRLHKGSIEVSSEEGCGSAFIIKLPAVYEQD